MIESGRTPNLQAAVYKGGKLAVSIATGRTPAGGIPDRRSLYCILSCTKLFTTIAMLTLHDRGYFEFDQPIADHWPEFGTLGKERITFRHVLSHRAGLRLGPAGTTWTSWGDQEAIGRLLSRMSHEWEPGERVAYHGRNFGFLLDHVVWRWLGKGIGDFLREEVCGPLGVTDFHLGLSRELYDTRLVKVVPLVADADAEFQTRAAVTPEVQDPEFNPLIGGERYVFNSFELLRLPLAWGAACATAEAAAGLANFFTFKGLYKTVRLFSERTFEEAAARPPDVPDADGGAPALYGLGLRLDYLTDSGMSRLAPAGTQFSKPERAGRTVGHGGGQTATIWVDVDRRLSAATLLGGLALVDLEKHRHEFAACVYQDLVS